MREDFLVFGSPLIGQEEINEVVDSLKSGWIGTGPKVVLFEKEFAKYKEVGASRVAAVNSCTAALHLSLLSLGIKPGDEVITTPMTFCATVNAIIHSGARPVLADIDPVSMNINPKEIEKKINNMTRAILPVHFAGRPCDMDAIMSLAAKNDLKVIEDCAHAVEAEYNGQKAGTFGEFACFSFYVTKNLITGEGGMALCQDEGAVSRFKTLALHGMSSDAWRRFSDVGYKHYFVEEPGFKYNMMDLQAAIGIHQLARLEENYTRRAEIWNDYNEAFADLPITLPTPPEPDTRHAYHLYTILVDGGKTHVTRDEFLAQMTDRNIGVGVHYMSIPEHPFYQREYGWSPDSWPEARRIGRQIVSLPLSAKLTDEDVNDVVEAVREITKK